MTDPTITVERAQELLLGAETGAEHLIPDDGELVALCKAFLAPERSRIPPDKAADLLEWAAAVRYELEERRQAEPRDHKKNQKLLARAIEAVCCVRDDCFKAKHRVDEGVCEAALILLRKLRDAQEV